MINSCHIARLKTILAQNMELHSRFPMYFLTFSLLYSRNGSVIESSEDIFPDNEERAEEDFPFVRWGDVRVSGDRRELNFLLSLELLSRQKVHPDLGFVLSTVREYELEILFQHWRPDWTPWSDHWDSMVLSLTTVNSTFSVSPVTSEELRVMNIIFQVETKNRIFPPPVVVTLLWPGPSVRQTATVTHWLLLAGIRWRMS